MKRIYKLIEYIWIFALSFTLVLFTGSKVSGGAVTYDGSNGSSYQLESTLDSINLGYGVLYKRDSGYTKRTQSEAYAHQWTSILTIAPSSEVMLVPYCNITGSTWSRTMVIDQAIQFEKENPGYKVIGGVNGSFYNVISGNTMASLGSVVSQGNYYKTILDTTSDADGRYLHTIGFKNDGSTNPIIGVNDLSTTPYLIIYDENDEVIKKVEINKVNTSLNGNETGLYYLERSANNASTWSTNNTKVTNSYVITNATRATTVNLGSFYGLGKIDKYYEEFTFTPDKAEFAIKSLDEEVNSLLKENVKVKVQYEYNAYDLDNYITVQEPIIENGVFTSQISHALVSSSSANPRTIVGFKKDGTMVLMVIDGRQSTNDYSIGVYGTELCAMFKAYGIVTAWNLDGGGSSQMFIKKTESTSNMKFNDSRSPEGNYSLANHPSENKRKVADTVLIVVKEPTVNVELSGKTTSSITLNVNLEEEHSVIKDLYVSYDGSRKKVVDGKITIKNLPEFTNNKFIVYGDFNGSFTELKTIYAMTDKEEIKAKATYNMTFNEDGIESNIKFRFEKLLSPSKVTLKAQDESYLLDDDYYIEFDKNFNFISGDYELEAEYSVNGTSDKIKIKIENIKIETSSPYAKMAILMKEQNNKLKDLFN